MQIGRAGSEELDENLALPRKSEYGAFLGNAIDRLIESH